MSAEIAYLANLHKEGKISDSALDKALNALQPAQNGKTVGKKVISSDAEIAKKQEHDVIKRTRQKRKELLN